MTDKKRITTREVKEKLQKEVPLFFGESRTGHIKTIDYVPVNREYVIKIPRMNFIQIVTNRRDAVKSYNAL